MKISRRFIRISKIFFIILFVLAAGLYLFVTWRTPVTKNIDSHVYELPFEKGGRYQVVQGYGGLFSHRHIAALDFSMPVGTAVCAARAGTVYSYKDDSDAGGLLPRYKNKANYLIIRHDDGSFGCYWHLRKNGVLVKRGRVATGQQIGWSGATGLVLRPHLHFSVKVKLNYEMNSFIQTRFNTTDGLLLLKRGGSYERPAG